MYLQIGQIIKLDRSFPLIKTSYNNKEIIIRGEFNAELSKLKYCATIGDFCEIALYDDKNLATIHKIKARNTKLVRKDPVNRGNEQVLASNFTQIAICNPYNQFNIGHIVRELVISRNSRVPCILIITKCDQSTNLIKLKEKITINMLAEILSINNKIDIQNILLLLHKFDKIILSYNGNFKNIDQNLDQYLNQDSDQNITYNSIFDPQSTTILLGKSGVGKSTLINNLLRKQLCKTGEVRSKDNKGRHTTVSREIITLDNNAKIVDMPGVRALGLINCRYGLECVFEEIYSYATNCKFSNCIHLNEPGCAVRQNINEEWIAIWRNLSLENS